jgi:hypothetical protein
MIKATATRASNLHTCRCGARANGVGAMVNIHRPLAIVLLLFFVGVAEGSRVGVYRGHESAQLRRVTTELWTPADLDDLFSWWKADSLDLSNDDLVSTWTDSSGNGYSVTASGATRPTFKTSQFNGLPSLYFGGAQWLTTDNQNAWTFMHSAQSTIIAVWQAGIVAEPNINYALIGNNAGTGNNRGFNIQYDDRDSASRNDLLFHLIGRGGTVTPQVVFNESANGFFPANTLNLLSVIGDPANSASVDRIEMRLNGGAATKNNDRESTPTTSNPSFPLQIGSRGDGSVPLTGYISEIVIMDALATTTDRQKLEGYLAHKWGLADNLPSDHPYKSAPPTK